MSVLAYIGLGSNLGDPQATVGQALDALQRLPKSRLIAHSSLYCSAPVGLISQDDFVNAAAQLETTLTANELLTELFKIEERFGRLRSYRNAPRTLDLDLLLYGDTVMESPTLTLPHPRLHERAFVLYPLLELDPKLTMPGLGAASALITACGDQRINKIGTV